MAEGMDENRTDSMTEKEERKKERTKRRRKLGGNFRKEISGRKFQGEWDPAHKGYAGCCGHRVRSDTDIRKAGAGMHVYPERIGVPCDASGYQLSDAGWIYPGLWCYVRGNLTVYGKAAEVCGKTV